MERLEQEKLGEDFFSALSILVGLGAVANDSLAMHKVYNDQVSRLLVLEEPPVIL